jgi:CHAT domain-containing protein
MCRLESADRRRAYLEEHPELVNSEVVERLAEEVRRLLRVDLDEALRKAETALAIAEQLGASESLARALRAKANALWFKGQCKPSVELLERAAGLFGEIGRADEVGRTLSTSIQPLILLGEFEQAHRNAERAREIFTQLNDGLRLARLDINVANIYHRQERLAYALATYERVYTRLLEHGDTEGVGVVLHNMAVCLIGLNQFERALHIYQEAREFFGRNQMPLLLCQAEYNIAYLYYLRGDHERAINGLRGAREISSKNGDAYHTALCHLDLSEIYVELNMAEEAAEMAQEAADRFGQLGMAYEAARALTNLAAASSARGDKVQAMALFARAKESFAGQHHRTGESAVNLYQAILAFDAGDYTAAKPLCQRAQEFFRGSGLNRKAAICDILLSRLALAGGHLPAAGDRCQEALDRLATLEAPIISYHAHLQFGRIHEASGDFERSSEAYHAARSHLENLRSSLQGEEPRIAFMKGRLEVYERLVGLCLRRGSTGPPAAEAFSYMEQAKCRSLLDVIHGRAQPLATRSAGERVEAQVLQLRGELNWFYHRIELEQLRSEDFSSERVASLWEQARACEDALLRVIRETPAGAPEARIGLNPAPMTVAEIHAALAPDAVLVEYFQTGEQILAAVLTADGIDIVSLTTAQRIENAVRMLQFQLSKFHLAASYTGKVEKHLRESTERRLRELYQELVAPLRSLLKGSRLILAPHGALHHVPMHALHDGTEYLIDRFTVSYVPNASVYALCRQKSAVSASRSLILGVQDSRTPWISREVQEVAAVAPDPHLLLGAEASQEALRRLGPGSRQIHIATHGVFRSDNPMFSSIRLADAYLSLYDLYSLRLPVDLITLSGCATGLNVVTAGDELMGLARGLLYGGAHALLLTLWDVQDGSTAEFMREFYFHLSDGTASKALALKTAMLEVRRRYPHPFHWAPFILVGKAP